MAPPTKENKDWTLLLTKTFMTERKKKIEKPKSSLDSLNFCIEGIIYAFRHEKHVRYHYGIAALALIVSLVLRLPAVEFALLAISIVILLFAEMVNTAIEEVVNLVVGDEYNVLAKNAKDMSAGAVLISSIGVIIMAYMILSKYLFNPITNLVTGARDFTGHLAFISLLLVVILVVAFKAFYGKGKPLYGGLPSGHAAVAFSLWASVSLISLDAKVVIMTLVMAVLVSHSRLIGRIHTGFEVFVGALLGSGFTFLVFYLYSLFFSLS